MSSQAQIRYISEPHPVTGITNATQRLWVRPLNALTAQLLPGSEGAMHAFWSPDNSEVAVIDAKIGSMWLVDFDGTGLRQAITSDYQPAWVSWRPVPLAVP